MLKAISQILFFFLLSLPLNADVHGVVDIELKNDYITSRGLLVTDTGLTIQILTGLSLDLTDDIALNFGIWNDLWTEQDNPYVGAWNELDWYIGITANLGNCWKLAAQFIEFVSPPHNFRPENNAEFVLSYSGSRFNPYIKLFWGVSGDSTVVVGRRGDTYYFEFGMVPSFEWDFFTLTLPTWISIGPESYWNGSDLALKNSHSNFGLFSTGLKARVPLECISIGGNWYIDIGAQYYYLINDNLLQAQRFTLQTDSPRRHVGVGMLGVGFEF